MAHRVLLLGLLAAALLVGPPQAQAGRGGVLATGWGGVDDSDYLKGTGRGVYVFGGARTVYRWRALRSSTDRVVPFSPLHQSFRFTVRDDRNRHRVSFETAVRGGTDLYRGGFRGEVLYAFVDLAPEGRWASVRFGRQLVATGGVAGLTRFDGVSARLVLHKLALETYAGASLRSRAFVVPEAERETHETGWGRDWTYGFALAVAGLRATQLRLGFQDRFRDGQLARRHLTIDFHQGIRGRVSIRGNLAVDLLQRRLHEVLAAVEGRPTDWLRLGIEYEHWEPSFDATGIFSVFNTDPFDGLQGRADAQLGGIVDVWVGGGFQVYPAAVTRDNVPRAEVGRLAGTQRAGVRITPVEFLHFVVDERLLDGTGGRKFALSFTGRVTPLERRLEVGLRGDLQTYDFALQPQLAGTYGGIAADVAVRPTPWMKVGVRGETLFSPWLKNNFQVAATLDFLLGIKFLGKDAAGRARLDDFRTMALAGVDPRAASAPGLDHRIGMGGAP